MDAEDQVIHNISLAISCETRFFRMLEKHVKYISFNTSSSQNIML